MKRGVVWMLFAAVWVPGAWAAEAACTGCVKGGLQDIPDKVIAETAPMLEPDWQELLTARVREADRLGLFDQQRRKTQRVLAKHAQTPARLHLPVSEGEHTHTVILMDEQRMSALAEPVKAALAGFARQYVFFDADDADQLKTVSGLLKKDAAMRSVATAGNVIEASQILKTRIWADQGGNLTRRFEVSAVPAVVKIARVEDENGAARIEAVVKTVAVKPENAGGHQRANQKRD